MRVKKIVSVATIALVSAAILSCNSIARESGPVELIVSGTQNLNQIDLKPGASGCAKSLGTVQMRVLDAANAPVP